MAPRSGTWPSADQVAGLEGDVHLSGGLLEVVEDLGAVVELVELGVEKLGELLLAVVVEDVLLVLGEVGRVRGLESATWKTAKPSPVETARGRHPSRR